MVPTVELLEAERAERAADMRMRSAEHWLALCADMYLQAPCERLLRDMRNARDEWRSRQAVHAAALAEVERIEAAGRG